MIDITFLLALLVGILSLIVILGIAQEAAMQTVMQRHRDEVLSNVVRAMDAKAREAQADDMVLVWTGSSKVHEEANHAIEEIIC